MVEIHVFDVSGEYLFRHYFDGDELFDELQEYYNGDEYRFEVAHEEFDEVRDLLYDHGHDLVIVDDPDEFCVVKEQYTKHAEILKNSVMHWTRRDHNFFLLQDPFAVEKALQEGATRVTETELSSGI